MNKKLFNAYFALVLITIILFAQAGLASAKPRIRQNISPKNVTPRTNITITRIRGFTVHGRKQMLSRNNGRGVSGSAILDAVRNGRVIRQSNNRTTRYKGKNAVVITNRRGHVVTTWSLNRNGERRPF